MYLWNGMLTSGRRSRTQPFPTGRTGHRAFRRPTAPRRPPDTPRPLGMQRETFHALRHFSATTRAPPQGVGIRTIAGRVGHAERARGHDAPHASWSRMAASSSGRLLATICVVSISKYRHRSDSLARSAAAQNACPPGASRPSAVALM